MSLKILVLTSTFPRWTGDQIPPFVFELSRRLGKNYQLHVLAPHAPGAKVHELQNGIQIYRFKYALEKWETLVYGGAAGGGILSNLKQNPWNYLLVPFFLISELIALSRLCRAHKYDLIHAHWLIPQGLIAALCSSLGLTAAKILCTCHGADLFGLQGRFWKPVKEWVVKRCDGITVVSRAMRDELLSFADISEKVWIRSMGVDLEKQFVPPSGPRKPRSLLFVGRLVEKKGLEYLIKALPLVLEKYPDACLRIAGSGPEQQRIRDLIIQLNLDKNVLMLGAVPNHELAALYQSSEILVFPSVVAKGGDQEGLGLVLVEAMGCECAVIGTDLASLRDVIIENRTGLIVSQKNPLHLAEAVNYLFQHPDLRVRLGKAGRDYVLKKFDWRIVVEKYQNIMDDLAPFKN